MFPDGGPASIDEFVERESEKADRSWVISADDQIVACAFASKAGGVVRLRLYWRKAAVVVEALRTITAELLQEADVFRVEWLAWADALNVLHMGRQAGGVREGVFQKSALRGGVPADQMMLAWVKEA